MTRTLKRISDEAKRIIDDSRRSNEAATHAVSCDQGIFPRSTSPYKRSQEWRSAFVELSTGNHKDRINMKRCRPRIPSIVVQVRSAGARDDRFMEVAYLQDYDDRLSAIRECLRIMFTSATELYKRLDINGDGVLTFEELEHGLRELRVPWQQITGLTRAELFASIGTRQVDILQFIGRTCLTARPHWSLLTLKQQWEEYCNKVVGLDLVNTSYGQPLWAKIDATVPRNVKTSGNVGLNRDDLDFIQTKTVRIEKFLADFGENKRDLIKLRNDLSTVTDSEERAVEIKRRREEEERERQRAKRAAGMALVTADDGNTTIPIFRRKKALSVFNEPSQDELIGAFDDLVSAEELEFRKLLKSYGIAIHVGDRLRSVIRSVTSLHEVSQTDFESAVNIIATHGTGPTRQGILNHWTSFSHGRPTIPINELVVLLARSKIGSYSTA